MTEDPRSLVVFGFDQELKASEMLTSLTRLSSEGSLLLLDAVFVTRTDKGKVRVVPTTDPTPGQAAWGGAFWGLLFGALLFVPVIGMAIGAGWSGMSAKLIDTGIPALSWMLVAVFWFKAPETRIFFILTVILLPFYALNVYEGVRSMSSEWLDMLESFRPSRWQTMRYLIIPHTVPYVLLTTKSVIGYAIRMVIFAELVASAVGIGSRMSFAQSTFRIDQVLAWTFLLVILNLIFQWLAGLAEKHLLKWRKEVTVR